MQAAENLALTSLIELGKSWDQCIALLAQSEKPKDPLTNLFLIGTNNQTVFTLKETVDQPPFFPLVIQKIFDGDTKITSFKLQMQKIEKLFNSVSNERLSKADQLSLRDLERNLNALGSYVFVQRQLSLISFSRSENIQDYQLRYTTPTELPPPAKINRSLRNYSGTICWLNSAIKYLAATKLYEKNICHPVADLEFEGLRQKIFFLVEALRNNAHQQIVNSLQKELIEYLKLERFAGLLRGQQDPNDFLVFLRNHFANPLSFDEQIQTATIYKSLNPAIMKAGTEKPGSTRLQISATEREKIDIQEELSQEQVTEDIGAYLIKEEEEWRNTENPDDKFCFKFKEVTIHLPDLLEIWLTRGIIVAQGQKSKALVSQQEIVINADGTLVLIEYEPKYELIRDQVILVDAKPKAHCTFKIIAAIERLGEKTERGHFVAYTRSPDNVITKHNDRVLNEQKEETVWKKASLLQLECVKRTEIQSD